jgi:hypothetical protein
MIPTMILFGLVFGRWWRSTLIVGTVGWPVLLLTGDILQSAQEVAGAAALGFANTLVGVSVHQLVLRVVRNERRARRAPARHRA